MAGHISTSGSNDWNTPEYLLELVREFFQGDIHLDPCSNSGSTVGAAHSFTFPDQDGLLEPWRVPGVDSANVFVNPPYGPYYVFQQEIYSPKEMKEYLKNVEDSLGAPTARTLRKQFKRYDMKDWAKKMSYAASHDKAVVVALIPCKPGTKPWQDTIFRDADCVCFIRGRPVFAGATAGAPTDCVFVLFDGTCELSFEARFRNVFGKKEIGYVVNLGA